MNKVDFLEFSEVKPCFERPFSGVQLLPYQYTSYVLPLNLNVVLEAPLYFVEIFVIDCFGNKTKIGDTKNIDSTDFNSNKIILKNIQYDLDRRVVLNIKASYSIGGNVKKIDLYSNILKITSERSYEATRIDYKCKDELYSIQLQMYEHHSKRSTEVETYTQVSTNNQVSFLPSNVKYYTYQTDLMYVESINKIVDVFQNKDVYFNNEKVNLFSAPELDDLEDGIFMTSQRFEVTKLGLKLDNNAFLGSNKEEYIITNNNEKIKVNGR